MRGLGTAVAIKAPVAEWARDNISYSKVYLRLMEARIDYSKE